MSNRVEAGDWLTGPKPCWPQSRSKALFRLPHLVERARDRVNVDAALQILPYGQDFLAIAGDRFDLDVRFAVRDRVLGALIPLLSFHRVRQKTFARVLHQKELVGRHLLLRAGADDAHSGVVLLRHALDEAPPLAFEGVELALHRPRLDQRMQAKSVVGVAALDAQPGPVEELSVGRRLLRKAAPDEESFDVDGHIAAPDHEASDGAEADRNGMFDLRADRAEVDDIDRVCSEGGGKGFDSRESLSCAEFVDVHGRGNRMEVYLSSRYG